MTPFIWIFGVVSLLLLVSYHYERAVLRHHIVSIFGHVKLASVASVSDVALKVAANLYRNIDRKPDRPFLLPVFEPLGSTPLQVLRFGGCCSGITRLYILLLREIGIAACQITVYDADGNAKHCLADIDLGIETLAVDATYGLSYRDRAGRPVGLASLRAGVEPVFEPVPGETVNHYPAYPYFEWDYPSTKTASWTRSGGRKMAYRLLRPLTRGRIDDVRFHPVLEWPQLILFTLTTIAMLTTLVWT